LNKVFKLGASYTIGSHILPGEPIINIAKILESKIKLTIQSCDQIIEGVKSKEFDLGLIESPIFDDDLIYKKWMEDELVLCSKNFMGNSLGEAELSSCQLLCRKSTSPTRMFISDFFSEQGLSYQTFDSLTEIDNATAAIQGIKWSNPNRKNPTVAIVSQLAIEGELEKKVLHQSRINEKPMKRNFYLIHDKEDEDNLSIDKILKYLKMWK